MLASNSVQEAMDLALIAHAATLESRIPFLHFFDGFRTSHEVAKIEQLSLDDMRAMIDDDLVRAHRARALSPDHPVHARHGAESRRLLPGPRDGQSVLPGLSDHRAERDGQVRRSSSAVSTSSFDYVGAPDAERVIVLMGSGAEAAEETVDYLTSEGEKVGVLKVRLYRPFSVEALRRSAAVDGEEHRRARPHQGARRHRRAAVSGCCHGAD